METAVSRKKLERAYMLKWRETAAALERFKREEFRAMTDDEARATSEMLLGMGPFPGNLRPESVTSGLVEQQRIFARARC
jgi:hypothetical protein